MSSGLMMSWKKVWFLSFLILTVLITVLIPFLESRREQFPEFGMKYNEVRDSLGIPLIEENWILFDYNDNMQFWKHPIGKVYTHEPFHFYKEQIFENGKLRKEIDGFHYETNGPTAYRIKYTYNFNEGTWNCYRIDYNKNSFPQTSSASISILEADSVLKTWKISR